MSHPVRGSEVAKYRHTRAVDKTGCTHIHPTPLGMKGRNTHTHTPHAHAHTHSTHTHTHTLHTHTHSTHTHKLHPEKALGGLPGRRAPRQGAPPASVFPSLRLRNRGPLTVRGFSPVKRRGARRPYLGGCCPGGTGAPWE